MEEIIDVELVLGLKDSKPNNRTTLKERRLNRLTRIFTDKSIELRKLAIDKPYMNDAASIAAQEKVYDEMYNSALKGLYDPATNKAIIEANNVARYTLARATLLMNNVRSVIEKKIFSGSDIADKMMDMAEEITIDKYTITDENLEELKKKFNL